MATEGFALNTEPPVAAIGDTELLFQPEVMGDDLMDGYVVLRDAQQAIGVDIDNLENLDSQAIRNIAVALREFLARLMLPESAELITRLQVSQAGRMLDTFTDRAEAEVWPSRCGRPPATSPRSSAPRTPSTTCRRAGRCGRYCPCVWP
ncbi:hypothetical protein SPW_5634 [Streptomyces sp. W007]|nr:hypothetical protein SPW_5634 [Streptomyces sp. W007]